MDATKNTIDTPQTGQKRKREDERPPVKLRLRFGKGPDQIARNRLLQQRLFAGKENEAAASSPAAIVAGNESQHGASAPATSTTDHVSQHAASPSVSATSVTGSMRELAVSAPTTCTTGDASKHATSDPATTMEGNASKHDAALPAPATSEQQKGPAIEFTDQSPAAPMSPRRPYSFLLSESSTDSDSESSTGSERSVRLMGEPTKYFQGSEKEKDEEPDYDDGDHGPGDHSESDDVADKDEEDEGELSNPSMSPASTLTTLEEDEFLPIAPQPLENRKEQTPLATSCVAAQKRLVEIVQPQSIPAPENSDTGSVVTPQHSERSSDQTSPSVSRLVAQGYPTAIGGPMTTPAAHSPDPRLLVTPQSSDNGEEQNKPTSSRISVTPAKPTLNPGVYRTIIEITGDTARVIKSEDPAENIPLNTPAAHSSPQQFSAPVSHAPTSLTRVEQILVELSEKYPKALMEAGADGFIEEMTAAEKVGDDYGLDRAWIRLRLLLGRQVTHKVSLKLCERSEDARKHCGRQRLLFIWEAFR
ncbi:hypothetical protein AUEXF2481DRAFT_27108 [Aureobasidium subglaciale EXF-2481]|uniref:Uncharacterized protein n=1 Tax=Aureobasidium subglaciale (strain EXF-2481) TaxID=1043005 RepID=A0A074ZGR7_AURSE|nr:uncharacterized protein AUEXF2481DRAFT_27108 [Aureobasidium subglaciale EXF-2481]KEQ97751.1 hypothetical protein AUEXF2481DRAFT_27108 [Aureobasidium subglaciale EXF-2481]